MLQLRLYIVKKHLSTVGDKNKSLKDMLANAKKFCDDRRLDHKSLHRPNFTRSELIIVFYPLMK